jgi:hypothetical protein
MTKREADKQAVRAATQKQGDSTSDPMREIKVWAEKKESGYATNWRQAVVGSSSDGKTVYKTDDEAPEEEVVHSTSPDAHWWDQREAGNCDLKRGRGLTDREKQRIAQRSNRRRKRTGFNETTGRYDQEAAVRLSDLERIEEEPNDG